ncbi:MAG: choice-of-anchor P family protein [Labedaea sp.]
MNIPAQPTTGAVRTADATATATPCASTLNATVITARNLCPSVVTTLNPGTATATSVVRQTTVGVPGLPVIALSDVRATASTRCGAATGSVTVTVTVAGVPIPVATDPNTTVSLPGGTRLTVNEQKPVAGADFGVTVVAVHLVLAGGLGEVTVGSVTSAVHNCG